MICGNYIPEGRLICNWCESHSTKLENILTSKIVFCKDCKYYNINNQMYDGNVCIINRYCDGTPIEMNGDDYCSRGERKY